MERLSSREDASSVGRRHPAARLIAIVGGSCSGKSWFASRLTKALKGVGVIVSLDDFYLDRSHLSLKQRARLNFDHPRAIDWARLERVLGGLLSGEKTEVPRYDFATHARKVEGTYLTAKPVVIVEGLWLLHPKKVRELFDLSIYLDAPLSVCRARRLDRDVRERGRTVKSVREQFNGTVAPMHEKFVAPQRRWAHIVLGTPTTEHEVKHVAKKIRNMIPETSISI